MLRLSLVFITIVLANSAFAQRVVKVEVDAIEIKELVKLQWVPGSIFSNQSDIASRYSGEIQMILEVGTIVKKGDLLVQIDSVPVRLEKRKAETTIQIRQAHVTYLQRHLERLNDLMDVSGTTSSEIEDTERQLTIAKQELLLAQIILEEINLKLSYTEIRAPFDAIVSSRYASIGEVARLNEDLLRIADSNNLVVQAFAPSKLALTNKVGDPTLIRVQDTTFQSKVSMLVPVTSNTSRQFEVRGEASGNFIIGESAWIALKDTNSSTLPVVPRDAIVLRQDGAFVFTVNDQGDATIVNRVKVELVGGEDDYIGIKGNVAAGQMVVIKGGEGLRDQQRVTILQPELRTSVIEQEETILSN